VKPAEWLRAHARALRWIAGTACALPGAWLALAAWQGWLGPNPLEALVHGSGEAARTLLLATLSVTPLRDLAAWSCQRLHARSGKRLSDWNALVPMRRMLGLWCFAYACAHAAIVFELDLGRDLSAAAQELAGKPYLAVGAAALAGLAVLAATSSRAAMVAMGRGWSRLHRLVYPIAVLVLVHECMTLRAGIRDAWPQAVLLALLLGHRLLGAAGALRAARQPGYDAAEVAERVPGDRSGQTFRASSTR
jgi:sulfoxide reductase heme-binding subunit YedZ